VPRRTTSLLLTLVALLLAASFGAPGSIAPAQAQQQQSLQINQVDGSRYPEVRAVVSAIGPDGAPAALTLGSVRAFEGEDAITVVAAQPASDPNLRLGVAIVVDVSSRMEGAPLDAAKQAAIEFIEGLGPADEVAVFAFNDRVSTVMPFTVDRNAIVLALLGLQAGGGSALYEATQTGAYAASTSLAQRKAVVVFSGSGNQAPGSTVTAEGATGVAESSHVPVFTVGLGPGADEAFLESVAGATMGIHRAVAANAAPDGMTAIAAVLRSQHLLTMTAKGAADSKMSELRLIADLGGGPAGAVAPFRRGPEPLAGAAEDDGGGSQLARTALIGLLVLLAVGALALVAYGAAAWVRRWREERAQLAVVAPNLQRAAAQGLPQQTGELRAQAPTFPVAALPGGGATPAAVVVPSSDPRPPQQAAGEPGAGRFVEKTPRGRGQSYELGPGPIIIGSSRRECTIVLPESLDVAPVHARMWLRDGKYTLTHAGGFRRRTLVGGNATERCVLEHGDEVQIGSHRLVYEEFGNDTRLRF